MTKKHSYVGCRNENCDAIDCVDRRTYQSIIKNDTARLVELQNKLIASESARMVERKALLDIARYTFAGPDTSERREAVHAFAKAAYDYQPPPELASVIGKLVGALKECDCTCGSEGNSDNSDLHGGCIPHKTLDSVRGELEKIGIQT